MVLRGIWISENGRSTPVGASRGLLIGLCFSLLATVSLAVFGGFTLYTQLSDGPLGDAGKVSVAHWEQTLTDQQQELERLRRQAAAESAALGRQLAQMQARLLRMEALGQRVVQVAELDSGEFAFAEPAAVGGPAQEQSGELALGELHGELDALASRLRAREGELEILDQLIASHEHQTGATLGGRPVKWGWMSSPYGYRVDPMSGQKAWHAGVDFAGKANSDVIAVASGVVTFAGERSGYGKVVEISHGRGFVTRYGHHAELKVEAGQIVKKGQTIGLMGSTGRSTGPHVHFEVEKHGRTVDPAKYLRARA